MRFCSSSDFLLVSCHDGVEFGWIGTVGVLVITAFGLCSSDRVGYFVDWYSLGSKVPLAFFGSARPG